MIRRKILTLLICLGILLSTAGTVLSREIIIHPFQDEVDYLALLKIWPQRDWNPVRNIDYHEYISLLERLCNGRAEEPLFQVAEKINAPEVVTTYKEALTIAGIFMGYPKEDAFAKMKKITGELKKADSAQITGYDMAYIFYNLLMSTRFGQEKSLLDERYLVGNRSLTSSRVMQITENQVVLEYDGAFPLAKEAQVFLIREKRISPLSFSRVAVGMSGLEFRFNSKNEVQTIIIRDHYYPQTIRVLLSVELNNMGSSKSYDFSEIKVTATEPFKVCTRENGQEKTVFVAETGEVVTFKNQGSDIMLSSGQYTIGFPNRLYLKSYLWHNISFDPLISTPRNGNVSVYAGTLEIFPAKTSGYLNLVNELPIDRYLRKVVSAQVPDSWGKEVAKVQAIAARSYAIAQVTHGKFSDRSAHVDDSSTTQIYNSKKESSMVNEAIEETTGLVITYNSNVIDSVFFSASAGFTANSEEVWHNDRTKEFPGTPVNYLRAKSQLTKGTAPDLTNEANALAFFRSGSYKSFDSAAPFYRWKVILSRKELENTINLGLVEREQADRALGTDFIQTLKGTPIDPQAKNFSIGTLKDIKVVQRGEGGNMMVIDIIGTNGTYRVMKEYNIRFVIRPTKELTGSASDVLLYLNDGKSMKNYQILPSAFAAFDLIRSTNGDIEKVTIYGGGNGHGTGMSQWGIRGMVEQGYKMEQIIEHFYSGVKLEKIY